MRQKVNELIDQKLKVALQEGKQRFQIEIVIKAIYDLMQQGGLELFASYHSSSPNSSELNLC